MARKALDGIWEKAHSRSNAARENQKIDPGGVLAEIPKKGSFGFVDFDSFVRILEKDLNGAEKRGRFEMCRIMEDLTSDEKM
jgi:hypothetical protein